MLRRLGKSLLVGLPVALVMAGVLPSQAQPLGAGEQFQADAAGTQVRTLGCYDKAGMWTCDFQYGDGRGQWGPQLTVESAILEKLRNDYVEAQRVEQLGATTNFVAPEPGAATQGGIEFQYDTDAAVRVLECYARDGIEFCLVRWGIISQGFWSIPVEVWREDIDKLARDSAAPAPVDPNPLPVNDDVLPVFGQKAQPVGLAGCSPSPLTGFVPDSVPPSDELFRAKITDLFTGQAYDDWYYGVEFDTFEVGAPILNEITIDASQRAHLVTFGAPPNVPLYPVTTTFRVCEKESATTFSERFHDSIYFCFPKDGEWTCGVSESR